ncbi:MAG: hypothetical protein H7144_18265 [Burkholderiales bacterium]|nr:hypothetical protein [Phycisphaerae bacterium]
MILSRIGFKRAAAAALAIACGTSVTQAADDAYTFSAGVDATSHFISFGADVWGGGDEYSPFSAKSTAFGYGTLTAAFSDQLSGFVNIWSDLNDNVDSAIGGPIQEVDFNVGLAYTVDKFTIGVAHNYWLYAGDNENAVELSIGFNDADMISEGFALNPSLLIHWRYDGQGAQDESGVVQLGVKPAWTFAKESEYPITLAVPAAVALFTDSYQGGDSGFAYANIGLSASVPLKFIPEKFGAWSASASATFWYTPDDAIPGNPEESFVVTALSVGFSY